MRVRKAFVAYLTFLAVLSVPVAARSQEAPDNFGTTDGIDLWIPASSFTGPGGWVEGPAFGYFYSIFTASYHAVVSLPQGALLDSWRAFFYDNSVSNDFTVGLVKWLAAGNYDGPVTIEPFSPERDRLAELPANTAAAEVAKCLKEVLARASVKPG